MASKPSSIVRWGTDQTNETEPTSGQKDTGIVFGEAANSSRMNWILRTLGLWTSYLNDGDLTGAHTFGSTVSVTGLLTALAGLTAGANQHVTVSGTGKFKHGDVVTTIAGSAFQAGATAGAPTLPNTEPGYMLTASGFYRAELRIPVGARIRSAVLTLTADATASTRSFKIRRINISTDTAFDVATASSVATSSTYSLTLSAVDHVVEAGYVYVLDFFSGSGAADTLKAAVLTHDQP